METICKLDNRKIKITNLFTSVLVTGLLLLTSSAYAARLPKEKTAEKVIYNHFQKYGHKHKEGDFGTYEPETVEAKNIEEIHKHLVAVEADVKLRAGPIYRIRCILEKKSLRWKLVSWEKL